MCIFAGCFSALLCSERGWKQSQWKQENETGRKSSLRTQEFQQQGVSISALPCTEGQGESSAQPPPLLLSPTPSFPQIIGKISFFSSYLSNNLTPSNWWKWISIPKNTGQGQLCSLTKWGDPSCGGNISFLVFSDNTVGLGNQKSVLLN